MEKQTESMILDSEIDVVFFEKLFCDEKNGIHNPGYGFRFLHRPRFLINIGYVFSHVFYQYIGHAFFMFSYQYRASVFFHVFYQYRTCVNLTPHIAIVNQSVPLVNKILSASRCSYSIFSRTSRKLFVRAIIELICTSVRPIFPL